MGNDLIYQETENGIADYFADIGKMVGLGSGSQRKISDITPSLFQAIPVPIVIPANAGIHNG